jgi:peptidoglycan/xylan/chitin deacetylase (PgdA/CDA1 family)
LKVPLLGASLERSVGNSGTFKEIAKKYPAFAYVLTQGKNGKRPKELNKYYPTTGQVIMRSGWEKKTKFENKFINQTQVVFDIGPYRTNHSDLDALSFNLYSNGKALITDTGLYTYEKDNKLKKYFHGTRGHNTVLVDGKDQRHGAPIPGKFIDKRGYTFQSSQHELYPQTTHQRSITLLGHDFVLIVDRMISDNEHDYEQLFHLFPGAKLTKKGETIIARGEKDKETITIRQLSPNDTDLKLIIGDEKTGNGFCSYEYEKKVPCPMLLYKQHAQNTSYVTLLEIGNNQEYISSQIDGNKILINTENEIYDIDMNELDINFLKESKVREGIANKYSLKLAEDNNNWYLTGDGSDKFKVEDNDGKISIIPNNRDKKSVVADRPYYTAEINNVETYHSVSQNITTDIPTNKERKEFKIYEQEDFLPILGYHHILTDDEEIKHPTLEMHASDFENQINYLTNELGCRWFTFGDVMQNYVLKGKKVPRKACILNFDDGRKDHFTQGYRIFKKYGAVATFYIISERAIDGRTSYMNISELNELYKNGNEIGSHTVNASSLVEDGYDTIGLQYQLEESKKMLEEQGYEITTFAYPRGDQNEQIVNGTKDFYIAGRDTSKDNNWRDRRPLTTSYDKDYAWHMHYHKPELETPEELKKSIWYNNWWQFEEGYHVDAGDSDVRVLTSVIPTETSFAVVNFEKADAQISNKFIVSQDAKYVIEIFGIVNKAESTTYSSNETMSIYVDDVKKEVKNNNDSECTLYGGHYYCFYNVAVDLAEGEHVLSVKVNKDNINLDKFRIYRPIEAKKSYDVTIKELRRIPPREHSRQIQLAAGIQKKIPLFVWVLLPFILFPLVYFNLKKW